MSKLIVRIKGGLGNQLFCYAAARRLALVNDAELIIDDVSGFARDSQYRRQYALDKFNISARKATPAERLEPLERYRRALWKMRCKRKPFVQRSYLEQVGIDFDERLLDVKVSNKLYLDGLWQSENYFKDMEQVIRDDLQIEVPQDAANLRIAAEIKNNLSVSLHVRWFDSCNVAGSHNASTEYYRQAIELMESRFESPRYFVFSDNIEAAREKLDLPMNRVRFVSHNDGDENAYADLWLISQCRHFVTANSTFSWWGAWLGGELDKIVVTPGLNVDGKAAWGFRGLIPPGWISL
ncbi:alpha-1,2-fucosyltransferase [Desulfoluna spongiiphila]|uniref:Glycosyl transferase family 11 n=1 Tax=Desulfoluna spongiiphila TaxID=419481 RepID=A0A1G5JPQ5_9BACT|nr:alpha-1,2-fucosyltransferase [Desulfoluna spongiiphila]SCY90375.1 Glycosyl transferase family 11 [Desulfoluna spongiiphila]